MNATDFLIEKLNNIFEAHSYLEIRYEFRVHINTHIIDVRPLHCFEGDKDYIEQQIALEDLFEEYFPDQEIVFISDNPLLKVKDPILSLGVSNLNVHVACISQEDLFAKVKTEDYDVLVVGNSYYIQEPSLSYEAYNIVDSRILEAESEPVYFLAKAETISKSGILSKIPERLKKLNKIYKKDSEIQNTESFFFNIAV